MSEETRIIIECLKNNHSTYGVGKCKVCDKYVEGVEVTA